MSEQLELFPELLWEDVEYQGKTYRRYTGGGKTPYRKKVEMEMKLKRFIDEYKKTI
tara:strand:+ start:2103 stop:2270 length:168 start_codon:yes stop_codon:yes gene_type:complete